MSLSYLEAHSAADVTAIRARLRIEWRHRAVVNIHRSLHAISVLCPEPAVEKYLLPLISMFMGVALGLWFF